MRRRNAVPSVGAISRATTDRLVNSAQAIKGQAVFKLAKKENGRLRCFTLSNMGHSGAWTLAVAVLRPGSDWMTRAELLARMPA
jgi:hypothetical protein